MFKGELLFYILVVLINFSLFFQAVDMLSNSCGSVPIIFLVTDGAVEDERQICNEMKSRLTDGESICPRIYTFGIGNCFLCLDFASGPLTASDPLFFSL